MQTQQIVETEYVMNCLASIDVSKGQGKDGTSLTSKHFGDADTIDGDVMYCLASTDLL